MKRVAIPVVNEKLSENFGQCSHYEIFEIEGKHINRHNMAVAPMNELADLPTWTSAQGITDIIVHKLDKRVITLFLAHKINLFVGVTVDYPQNLIEEYLSGKLRSNNNIINEITQ